MSEDVPEKVRSLPVATEEELSPREQEVRIVGAKDQWCCTVSTEIPTIVKWLQSLPSSTFQRVRQNHEGEIVSCKATVPKGVIKLQASARQSDRHSDMVSYGDARSGDDDG